MTSARGENHTVVLEEDERICLYLWDDGAVVTAEDARSCMASQVELLAGRRWPVLVRLAGIRSMTPEARRVFATEAPTGSSSRVAMLAESPVQRVLANFYMGLTRKQPVPVRMFTDETAAREWLRRAHLRRDRSP